MNYRDIIYMTILFILLPAWIGYIWVEVLKLKAGWSRFVHAWVMGFATILAVAQIILVPLVALKQTLTIAMIFWKAVLMVLALVSFLLLLRRWKAGRVFLISGEKVVLKSWGTENRQGTDQQRRKMWTVIFGVIAAILIFLQAYIPARYEHGDDDDARFISEEVSAVVHDTMYIDDPISASEMYWNLGEVKKDLTSPWAMYMAICSRISDIPPAVLSHTYLPFFLILLCYAVYLLIGHALMKGNWEKTFMFLILLSIVHVWGYTSTHTLASMLLLRIWQGKAVCASFMIPLFFYVMYRVMHREYERSWIVFLYVGSTGACLLSGVGIITIPVLLLIYGIVDFVYYRQVKKTLAIWMAAVPNAICLLYYLVR